MLVYVSFLHRTKMWLLPWLLGVGLCLWAGNAVAQAVQVTITSPLEGSVLQGVVPINGTSAVEGFRQAEIAFAYQTDPTNTWFTVRQAAEPVKDALLAKWDTTTISDGDYRLRLQVTLQDGQVLENVVTGLRVRNYTQVETNATQPGAGLMQPSETPTPSSLAGFDQGVASPTELPTNPAQITVQQLKSGAGWGILWVFGAMLVAGIYLGARTLLRR